MQLFRQPNEEKERPVCLNSKNTALVIVDVQFNYEEIPGWRDEIGNIRKLIEKCKEKGLPIIVVSINPHSIKKESLKKWEKGELSDWKNVEKLTLDDLEEGKYWDGYCCILPELEKSLDSYSKAIFVKKVTYDAFQDPRHELEIALTENGIQNIFVLGYNQSECLIKTVKTAVAKNYTVFTSIETMWGNSKDREDDDFRDMTAFYRQNTNFVSFKKMLKKISKIK